MRAPTAVVVLQHLLVGAGVGIGVGTGVGIGVGTAAELVVVAHENTQRAAVNQTKAHDDYVAPVSAIYSHHGTQSLQNVHRPTRHPLKQDKLSKACSQNSAKLTCRCWCRRWRNRRRRRWCWSRRRWCW
jgi:hypothetical protein